MSGVGSGVTVCDARHEGSGIVLLRKERFGRGNGRVYHVHYTAMNTAGMSCEGVVLVSVPHDQNTLALDDGELFDSTVGCQGLGMR